MILSTRNTILSLGYIRGECDWERIQPQNFELHSTILIVCAKEFWLLRKQNPNFYRVHWDNISL